MRDLCSQSLFLGEMVCSSLNVDVNPCDNFYAHICSNWHMDDVSGDFDTTDADDILSRSIEANAKTFLDGTYSAAKFSVHSHEFRGQCRRNAVFCFY